MADPYETGVLDREVHSRLVANLDGFAIDAGIQPQWIYTPLDPNLPDLELSYVRNFPKHRGLGLAGLCLTKAGLKGRSAEDHMSAMAGAFVRNFIRARVLTLGSVIDVLSSGDKLDVSVLLIPNFCTGSTLETRLPDWQCRLVCDLLADRQLRGLQTVLYAHDLKRVGGYVGQPAVDLIGNHYVIVEG